MFDKLRVSLVSVCVVLWVMAIVKVDKDLPHSKGMSNVVLLVL